MNDDSPIIIVNLKAYEQGYGANGYDLCKIMEEIALEHKVNLAAAVSPIDLVDFSDNLDIPIFAQHVDGVNFGSHTGSILPEAVRYSGAVGTLVNHAECQMSWEEIEKTIKEIVKEKIGLWKYPRSIEFVNNLPKTATGKIQRFKLRK